MPYAYDMVVLGGGAAGLTAAGMAALLGAKTALVEAHRLGGDCTWTGCVPSKTLLRAAKIAHQMRTADRYGLPAAEPALDFGKVMAQVRAIRQQIYEEADAPPRMERFGMEVIQARARFLDPHTVELTDGGRCWRITSRWFVIATGSRPRRPAFAESVLTNESLFELSAQPQRLLVMGGGPVGIEMAQAFQRLGTAVTVVASNRQILPKDDPELAGLLRWVLEAEGVRFVLGQKVTDLQQGSAVLADGERISYDAVLAAIGREPEVDGLGLEQAGVRCESTGIVVDRRCRTSQRHIFAVGDVTGRYQFTHMAEHMSKVAVTNALLRIPRAMDEAHVVWSTFTDPELAHLGKSEEALQESGTRYEVYRFPFQQLDRAITEGKTTGLVKVFVGRRGKILGASVLGSHAGEMISEWALAMRNGLPIRKIADTIHPYPTYLLGNRRAADQWYDRQLASPLLGLLGKVFRFRGERSGAP